MLFDEELYILVYSAIQGTNNQPMYTPYLRGNLGVFTLSNFETNYPTYYYSNNYVFFVLSFQNNDGSFPGEQKTSSQSLGNGLLYFQYINGQVNQNALAIKIYTTIDTPGTYFLKCGGVVTTLNNGQTNPNPLVTQINTLASSLYLEMMANKECYVFITSSAYPNGDLFAWVQPPSNMDAFLMGSTEATPVQSPYYGRATLYFDYGTKVLSYLTMHNITSPITQSFLEFSNGTMICNVSALDVVQYCQLNNSVVPYFGAGQVYLNIYTTANPTGELRGQVVFNGLSSGSLSDSSLPPSNLAVGLGVGLGVGIPLLILGGVGIFFLVKRGGSSKL